MKKNVFTILFLSFFLSSCDLGFYQILFNEEKVDSRVENIEILTSTQLPQSFSSSDSIYSFVLFTDIHVGSDGFDEYKQKFLNWFSNQLSVTDESKIPRFAICLGDNMNTGVEYNKYNEYMAQIKKIAKDKGIDSDFKIYTTIGNHDLYHNGWENYKEHIFPYKSAYYFSDGAFSFYVLDSANGTLGEPQRESLKNFFKIDKKPKMIFTHVPIYAGGGIVFTFQDTLERNELLSLFQKNNVKQVFAGHAHRTYGYDYGSWREDVTASFKMSGVCRLVTINKSTNSFSSKLIEF